MNPHDYGEMNRATPSRTVNTPADLELARAYVRRNAPDLFDMLFEPIGGAS